MEGLHAGELNWLSKFFLSSKGKLDPQSSTLLDFRLATPVLPSGEKEELQ